MRAIRDRPLSSAGGWWRGGGRSIRKREPTTTLSGDDTVQAGRRQEALSGKLLLAMTSEPDPVPDLPPKALEALWRGDRREAIVQLQLERNLGLEEARELVASYILSQPSLRRRMKDSQSETRWGIMRWLILIQAIAVAIGYGIYRGGVRLDLARFFKVTGLVLVLVAAGLVATAFHTAHEAAWLNSMQGQTVDLRWLVAPGTIRSSLLTGLFGFQPRPVTIEAIGYLAYAIPMAIFVLWPSGLRLRRQRRPEPVPAGRPA